MLLAVSKRDAVGDTLQRDEAHDPIEDRPGVVRTDGHRETFRCHLARRRSTKDGGASARAGSLTRRRCCQLLCEGGALGYAEYIRRTCQISK